MTPSAESFDTARFQSYLTKSLDAALSDSVSSVKQSYRIQLTPPGVVFTPRLPSALILDADLYFRIFDILATAAYPKFTLIRPTSMQLQFSSDAPIETARGFFFPWKLGVSKRIIADTYSEVLDTVPAQTVKLMDGISYNATDTNNVIISGSTGSGKSVGLRFILESYFKFADITLIDPKLSDGARWARQHPEVELIVPAEGDRPEDFLPVVTEVLAKALQDLNNRQHRLFDKVNKLSANYTDLGLRPHIIVIDEVQSLGVGLKKSLLDDFQSLLIQLALLGRESGYSLVLALQSARADVLPVQVRDQMGVRILLGRLDSQSTQFLFPEMTSDFPLPLNSPGSGIVSILDGKHYGIEPIAMPTIKGR